jgi:hypothetical protein
MNTCEQMELIKSIKSDVRDIRRDVTLLIEFKSRILGIICGLTVIAQLFTFLITLLIGRF